MARETSTRGSKSFDPDFITPLTEPRPGKEVGPDVFNIPQMNPPDPLRLVPGGARGGNIKGGD
jgi:hypothetical protein